MSVPESSSMHLAVLGSGSRGNSAVLVLGEGEARRLVLIDLGLSPRRTANLLQTLGLCFEHVIGAVLTHLDRDHCHVGWRSRGALPAGARIYVHWGHARRATREGLAGSSFQTFDHDDAAIDTPEGPLGIAARISAHDDLGVAVLRLSRARSSVGYATDLGCVTEELVEHLERVGLLAIESNYCPVLQAQSTRPDFLKRRITGGQGHLSNHESARIVRLVRPRRAILLHLSAECNRPELALAAHAYGGVPIVVSTQDEPTGLVPVEPGAAPVVRPVAQQIPLFHRASGGVRT